MASSGLETLAAALAAGDQRAYAELYDRLAGRLFRTAMTLLGQREDAEDAVQDVFAAMVRSRDKLAGVEDLKAYVFASLRRSAARISGPLTWAAWTAPLWRVSAPRIRASRLPISGTPTEVVGTDRTDRSDPSDRAERNKPANWPASGPENRPHRP